jgi:hypothetical protein
MSVEWRHKDGADAIVHVDPRVEGVTEVATPDADDLKAYLAVAAGLDQWRGALDWRPVNGGLHNPSEWGELVLSRTDAGEVIYVDPELFWDGVYRWFRSRGVDYS